MLWFQNNSYTVLLQEAKVCPTLRMDLLYKVKSVVSFCETTEWYPTLLFNVQHQTHFHNVKESCKFATLNPFLCISHLERLLCFQRPLGSNPYNYATNPKFKQLKICCGHGTLFALLAWHRRTEYNFLKSLRWPVFSVFMMYPNKSLKVRN